jgi:cupin-like protein
MASETDDRNTGEDPAQRFVSGPVTRRRALTRAEFVTEFRGRLPVVHEQGASASPAVRRWDPEYLVARAGDAPLELLAGVYEPDAREGGYTRARQVATTLRELIESVRAGEERQGYLFNTHTGVFRVNAEEGELRVGWGERANPGLAPLAPDFELPAFMDPKELIYAALLLGGPRHRSPLHYDLSGEVKAIVQVRGRKRVLLFPPSQVGYLSFPCWFESSSAPFRVPHVADVDVHRPDFARFPEFARARCVEAVLEPGDVLYWPSFWPHDVSNLDPFTLAVTCSFEELHASSMWFREQLGLLGRLFLQELREGGSALGPEASIEQAFQRLERRLFSDELRELTTMWGWHNAIRHPREDRQPT